MKRLYLLIFVAVVFCFGATTAWGQDPLFIRGDCDANGVVDTLDIDTLMYYLSFFQCSCPLATDVDDNGITNVTDVTYLTNYLELGGPPPPEPFPDCGSDPTDPQQGDSCCTPEVAVPSMTLPGIALLVILLAMSGLWIYRRKKLARVVQ